MDTASQWTVAALFIAPALLLLCGNMRLSRVGAALLLNWLACTSAVYLSRSLGGDNYPWLLWLIIDAATAAYVLKPPATWTQVVIGAVGISQVLWHGAYAINPSILDTYSTALDWLGRAQLAVLIIGGGYGIGQRLSRRLYRSGNSGVAMGQGSSRVEGGSQ